jgi:zinc transport system substrate-binding protein
MLSVVRLLPAVPDGTGPRTLWRVLAALLTLGVVAGCAQTGTAPSGSPASPGGTQLQVVASFYPLAFVATEVGGARVQVTGLTPPGAEPHDLELTAQQVAALSEADLVVYLAGFQPAVDAAVDTRGEAAGSAGDADPGLLEVGDVGGVHGGDPHFWLDPTRLATVATAVAERYGELDPAGRTSYQANARTLNAQLSQLDADYQAGLASCRSRDLVVSHEAFGYLADRYDLQQVAIAGLDPQAEPSPGRLAELVDFVRTHEVRTIYTETLVSPEIAQTLAREAGVAVAVLDPIEGVTPDSPGDDYLQIMRANLDTLRAGQGCDESR